MKTTITFPMKDEDLLRLSELREPVSIVAGPHIVTGIVCPAIFSRPEVTCDVLEKETSNITIPVKSLHVKRDWSDEVFPIFGMGEMYPVWSTPGTRARHRALEGLRAYRKTLVTCTSIYEIDEDWPDEHLGRTVCGHGPEDHGKDGCCKEIIDYFDWDHPIYCPCEGYQKPAPLVSAEVIYV